jgi:colanic acid/amylovoran biosynthesis glycosyltransferase
MSASEKSSFGLTPPGPIAYLTPEFPGQTHTWIWREIVHMREWGVDIRLFSTRPPDSESAARHAFADQARKETVYLWPRPIGSIVAALAWAALKRPRRFLQAAAIVLTLDGMSLRERASTIPLIAAACVLARVATAQEIRHLHLHSAARSAVIAMMTHRLICMPYSIMLNASVEGWGGGMASKFAESEFTAVNAEWLLNDVRNGYPHLRASQVLLARPGVDTRAWVSGEPETAAHFHLVTVARLNRAKGHDVTMRALARLRRSGRDVRLSIVGDGPDRAALQELGERLGLEGVVHFVGSQSEEDVIRQLRSADAFVLASRSEPLGVAYMEAMALGLPTIGTSAGGVGEIITPERDGLLVPPEDDERLAAAVARLMDDPELRRRLARNARQTIVERFDSRIGAARIYERLFGNPPPLAEVGDR